MLGNLIVKLNDISIRNKLILMQVFTSVLVLGIVFTVFVITDINSYKQRKVDTMISLAQVVGTNNISTLQFQDDDAAKQILLELHNVSPEITQAGILDKNGHLFATYSKPGENFNYEPTLYQKQYQFANNHLFINKPIVSNNEEIGRVLLEVELSELNQIRQSKYEISAILLIVALVFSFLIAYFVQRYISKRLLRFVNTMKLVSSTGDYNTSITDNGKDEISTLMKVFNNMMRQIKENQQKKDEFIGIASHELKTPLTTIKGYMELLNGLEDKQQKKEFVRRALGSVKKLENLIKDLLDVSKIQSGQLELNITQFNVDDLLDETIMAIQMVTSSHQIIRKNSSDHKIISADRQRIEQVIVNLLSNAIKYSPGQSEVFVYSYFTDLELIIEVKDFGNGVSLEEQSNIFERFYRTKDLSVHISGFGLGLYICKDIITRHNGRIWVESDNNGSSFYFSMPINQLVTQQIRN